MIGLVTLAFYYLYVLNSLAPFKRSMGSSAKDKIIIEGNTMSKPILLDVVGNIVTICLLSMHYYLSTEITTMDLILLGFASIGPILRQFSYRELGKFYTFDIGIREDHKVIKSGVYKYIAHPGYTGVLSTYLSLICFSNTYIIVTIIMLLTTIYSFYNRIKNEEKMLIEYFGDEYEEYREKTKRFIPYVY